MTTLVKTKTHANLADFDNARKEQEVESKLKYVNELDCDQGL